MHAVLNGGFKKKQIVDSQNQYEIYLGFHMLMLFNEFTLTFVSYLIMSSLVTNGSLERTDCRLSS